MTKYIVFRRTGTERDGVWYDFMTMPIGWLPAADGSIELKGIGVYVEREDGARAEVYTPYGVRTPMETIEAALNRVQELQPGVGKFVLPLLPKQRAILVDMLLSAKHRGAPLIHDTAWANWILESPTEVTVSVVT